ncbi:MAG: hypothetical protein ACQEQN_04635 [Thermodesulfobacteriota bacterium]
MIPVKINEVRLSSRFLRLQQGLADEVDSRSVCLYRQLAADRINISFLHLDFLRSPRQVTCLVAPEAVTRLEQSPEKDQNGGKETEPGRAAGLVSLFPHRFHPAVIGAVFCALAQENAGWHCMATSGSMVTLAVDLSRQDRIAKAICRFVDLPPGKERLCPGEDYDVVARSLKSAPETVAQYVEFRIKTYGLQVKTGLTLLSAYIPTDELGSWGRSLIDITKRGVRFSYASAAVGGDGKKIKLDLVIDPAGEKSINPDIVRHLPEGGGLSRLEITENAEMICFHGPHFGDRYGIADKTLSRLGHFHVPVWLAGCVGATVTVVVPPDMGAAAEEALSDVFSTPPRDRGNGKHGNRHE